MTWKIKIRRSFNEEFKSQIVQLHLNGKRKCEIIREYDLSPSVLNSWNYICVLIDLFNREIIGCAGKNKDADLVLKDFATVRGNLRKIKIFHTDRGNEFKNHLIEKILDTFNIKRSLSMKGTTYDNAVAEAIFKTVKTEFIRGKCFDSLEEFILP